MKFSLEPFVFGVVLLDALLVLGQFLERLGLLCVREPYILLGVPDFLGESRVLLEQLLDLFLEGLTFLVVRRHPILVLIHFLDDLLVLLGRESQVFLGFSDFSFQSLVLADKSLNSLLETVDGHAHGVQLLYLF